MFNQIKRWWLHRKWKDCEVTIQFLCANMTKEERQKLYQVQRLLGELGISFDTGMNLGSQIRDWEWDWSLKGPVKVVFRRYVKQYKFDRFEPTTKYTETQQIEQDIIEDALNQKIEGCNCESLGN